MTQKYWKVTAAGPVPVMMDPEALRASDNWVLFHNYGGSLIFENYSRAVLCYQEMKDQGAELPDQAIINEIDAIIAHSGAGLWEQDHATTLYLSDAQREAAGYDCMTYYRGGWGYPSLCFVKQTLEGNNYGTLQNHVDYAAAGEFLALLKTQKYAGGCWRSNVC